MTLLPKPMPSFRKYLRLNRTKKAEKLILWMRNISARMLLGEIEQIDRDVAEVEEAPQIKMTLGSRLSPEALAKLKALRGR